MSTQNLTLQSYLTGSSKIPSGKNPPPSHSEEVTAIIGELDLSDEDKAAITYGLNLIIWLPNLILEQRISHHRLQLMLFGKATSAKSSKNNSDQKNDNNKKPEDNDTPSANDKSANDEVLDITSTSDVDDEPQKSGRTGRKPILNIKPLITSFPMRA